MLQQYSGAPDQIGIADKKEIREILVLRQPDSFPSPNVADCNSKYNISVEIISAGPIIPVVPEFRSFPVVPEFRSFSAFRSLWISIVPAIGSVIVSHDSGSS